MRLAAELFPDAGPACAPPGRRLRAAGPGPDGVAALAPVAQLRFKGHHGGRTPEETRTWVGIMQA